MGDSQVGVSAAVEGIVDKAVLVRLLADAHAPEGHVYVAEGKPNLRKKVPAYNHAASLRPWIVLVDLNRQAECAPAFRAVWMPSPSQFMCFRVAVRAVEAWLLADRERISRFLAVPVNKLPHAPDLLDAPKLTLANLARQSRNRDLREDMVPRPNSGRSEGPAYSSRLIEFVTNLWRPAAATRYSDSLRRCRNAIDELVARWLTPK